MADEIKFPFYMELQGTAAEMQKARTFVKTIQSMVGNANLQIMSSSNQYLTKIAGSSKLSDEYIRRISKGMKEFGDVTKNTAGHLDNLEQSTKKNLFQIAKWALGWNLAYGAINFVKNSIASTVKQFGDLEETFIRVKWAAGEANASMQTYTSETFKIAKATGQSVKEISESAKTWAQQGNSIARSLELTQAAAEISNVTMQDLNTTINNMTGIMNAWGYSIDGVKLAFDKIALVADSSAVSADVLADAFLKTGTTARDAGAQFNDLIGVFAAVNTVTRRTGAEIGTAFRTMFTRFRTPLTRDMIQQIAKVKTYLDANGQATFEQTGKVRGFSEVMRELAVSIKNVTEVDRDRLIMQLAGVRQMEFARAMFNQWDLAMKLSKDSMSALGYVETHNEELMGTFNKTIAQLAASFAELGQASISTLIPALTKVVKGLTNVIDSISYLLEAGNKFKAVFLIPLTAILIAVASKMGLLKSIVASLPEVFTAANIAITSFNIALKSAVLLLAFAWGVDRITTFLSEMNKLNEATKEWTKSLKDMDYVISMAMEHAKAMSSEKLMELRARTLTRMTELQTKGEFEKAGILAKTIRLYDEELKINKAAGTENEKSVEMRKKEFDMRSKHELAMMKLSGASDLSLLKERMNYLKELQTIEPTDDYAIQQQDLMNEAIQTYTQELLSLKDAYQDVVANGLQKFSEGTASLMDMVKEFSSVIRKQLITDALGVLENQTGIFKFLSSITTHPVTKAHQEGGKIASKMIIDAHIEGIKAGFAQSQMFGTGAGNTDISKKIVSEGMKSGFDKVQSSALNNRIGGAGETSNGSTANIISGNLTGPMNPWVGILVNQIKDLNKEKSGIEAEISKNNRLIEDAMLGKSYAYNVKTGEKSYPNEMVDYLKNDTVMQEEKLTGINDLLKEQLDALKQQTDIQDAMKTAMSTVASASKSVGGAGGGVSGAGGGLFQGAYNMFAGMGSKKSSGGTAKKSGVNWGGAAMGGIMAGVSEYYSARSGGLSQGASIAKGALAGVGSALMMTPTGWGQIIGGAMVLGSMLIQGKQKDKQTEVREQTKQITSRINTTNKELEIVNRNLIGLRRGFEGFILQESYYLRQRSSTSVNVQNEFALGLRRGASNV